MITSPRTKLSALLSVLFFTGLNAAEPAKTEVRPTVDSTHHLAVVNQVGYQTAWPKRFTAPLSADGSAFTIHLKDDPKPLFSGVIKNHIGDFTNFHPADDTREYVITMDGSGLGAFTSDPFAIRANLWREQFWPEAVNFMIDSRSVVGTHPSAYGGTPWRDGTYYDFVIPSIILLHLADPALIESRPHQIDWEADRQRITAPDFKFNANKAPEALDTARRYFAELEPPKADAPDTIKMIHWGLGYNLIHPIQKDPSYDPQGPRIHGQMVEQYAYLLWAWPRLKLDRWLPVSFRDRCAAFVKENWESSGLFGIDPRWEPSSWGKGADWNTPDASQKPFVGVIPDPFKGRSAPGHSIVPNLMMYDVATQAGDAAAAARYLAAAKEQAAWIVAHLDVRDPRATKGQRMSEHRTVTSLVWMLQNYPAAAPSGLKEWITAWAKVVIERSENMWDFRRYDLETNWSIPLVNEPGNLAGFPACALAASWVIDDPAIVARLRQIAVAHFDNLFGRNPMLSACAQHKEKGFPLVERDWPHKFPNGACAALDLCRGAICSSPGSEMYPFNLDGKFRHAEGWVNFNAAWNVSLVWFKWDEQKHAPAVK